MISDLQVALVGAGVGVVGAVWIYNLLQERKHKKAAQAIFEGGQPDVLLKDAPAGGRQEPVLAGDERIEPVAALPDEENFDVQDAPPADEFVAAAAPAPAPQPSAAAPAVAAPTAFAADDIVDCTLDIELAAPVAAVALWAEQATWAAQVNKPLVWMGHDEASQQWRRLVAGDPGSYLRLAVSLQLVDRQGAVGDAELNAFLGGVDALAHKFGGRVDLPATERLVAHAQSLDGFCAGVDMQLSVNVIAGVGNVIAGTKLRGLAEATGFVLGSDGRFHMADDKGVEWFTLASLDGEAFTAATLKTQACAGVVFTLDVPRVANGPFVFDRMVAAARQMASALGGTVADSHRHALGEPAIAAIRTRIGDIQQQMAGSQIPPGSQRALRLFN